MNTHPGTRALAVASAALTFLLCGCSKPAGLTDTTSVAPAASANASANVADTDVTTNVKTALLQDPALKGLDINVVTLKGDVRLIGVLENQTQIDAAIKLARAADGAHSIHDELTIKK